MLNAAWQTADATSGNDDGVNFSIYKDTTLLYEPALVFRGNNEGNRIASQTLATSIDVSAGDFIYFYVNRGSWQDCDGMYYSFSVTYNSGADLEPPFSSHNVQGNQLQLFAEDAQSSVAALEYAQYYPTWGGWHLYTGPITLPYGESRYMYRALDNMGNAEPYHRATFNVRKCWISGFVRDNSTAAPIAQATVVARNELGESFTAITDASGNYKIELPPYAGYYVSFGKPGYVPEWWNGDGTSKLEWYSYPIYVGQEYDQPDSVTGINAYLDLGGAIKGRVIRGGQGINATIYVYSTNTELVGLKIDKIQAKFASSIARKTVIGEEYPLNVCRSDWRKWLLSNSGSTGTILRSIYTRFNIA